MADEIQKTAEEKLLDAANNTGATADDGAGDSEGDDGLSPEEKIIAELREKAASAEERAKNAERERDSERLQKDTARKEASTHAERSITAQEETIKSNVQAAKSRFEAAQTEWDDAFDSGDKIKMREANLKLNDAQMQFRSAEYQENQFKTWKDNNKGVVVSSSGSRFTTKEQAWIDSNPRFTTDRKFRAAVYAADEEAREKKIEIDSQAYFKHIEDYLDELGLREEKPVTREAVVQDAPAVQPATFKKQDNKASTATPVGGTTGSSSGANKKNSITLSPEQREAARFTFPNLSAKEAEEKYGLYQIEIKQKKARGEL